MKNSSIIIFTAFFLGCVGPSEADHGLVKNMPAIINTTSAFSFILRGDNYSSENSIELSFNLQEGKNLASSLIVTESKGNDTTLIRLEDEDGGENSSVGTFNSGLREITTVLKLPVVWLIAVVVLAAYSAYWGTYRFTSYSTDIFSLSVVAAGAISIGKMWMSPPSALLAGFISDKIGIAKSVAILFVVLIFSFIVFAFMPGIPSLLPVMIVNVAIASLAVFALRGIYFALLEEGGIPMIITGTATGFISMIGFTPDVFMPLIGGVLLDNLPSVEGYRIFFLIVAGICGLGLMAALMIYRIVINRDTRH